MNLASFAATFDKAVAAEFKLIKNETLEVMAETIETVGEGINKIIDGSAAIASKLVIDLMADDTLSGLEKANLAATQLVENYALKGITVADQDATFIIKSAYESAAAWLRAQEV